jgi:hypothetical protein
MNFGAIAIIAVGVILYIQTSDNFAACASTIGGLVKAFDPASARECARVNMEHYGSIALMVFGGIVLFIGLIPGKKPS